MPAKVRLKADPPNPFPTTGPVHGHQVLLSLREKSTDSGRRKGNICPPGPSLQLCLSSKALYAEVFLSAIPLLTLQVLK